MNNEIRLVNVKDQEKSSKILNKYYNKLTIPAEKKPYLSKLNTSFGPYLHVDSNHENSYLLDAASQIATLGLGFNPTPVLGTMGHLESWTMNSMTKNFADIKESFETLINKKLGRKSGESYFKYSHSGAEANEIALGEAFSKRKFSSQKKVLAFKGSFHGRMQIALSSTWNPVKRKDFEWKDYLTTYLPLPDVLDGNIQQTIPNSWFETWKKCLSPNFSYKPSKNDELLDAEIESLNNLIKTLRDNKHFAIIIEPIQCEGGDKYSSIRFHQTLLLIAKSFGVAIIYDEVQSGYHLGNEFFWHQEFFKDFKLNLRPDYITCAKKAQIGLVIAQEPFINVNQYNIEEFSPTSFIRGYYQAQCLDQSHDRILKLGDLVKIKLNSFVKRNAANVSHPRNRGLAFSFDLKKPEILSTIVAKRFELGLLYYPAGDKTLRFRLNLAYREEDIDYLFMCLDQIFFAIEHDQKNIDVPTFKLPNYQDHFKFKDFLLKFYTYKLQSSSSKKSLESLIKDFESWLSKSFNLTFKKIDHTNFDQYQSQIENLEEKAYEPTRRTDIKKFKYALEQVNSLGFALVNQTNNDLVGQCISSPLSSNPFEYGTRMDPNYPANDRLYVLDTTIHPDHADKHFGKYLKFYFTISAALLNIKSIHGRTRDKMAGQMLSINAMLGSHVQQYIPYNYNDEEKYCDVNYYQCKTSVEESENTQNLSCAYNHNIPRFLLDSKFMQKNHGSLVNKMCLSNFVSENFLGYLSDIKSLAPKPLHHIYTTSGQSECVDKIIKSIWYKSLETKKSSAKPRFLTFKDHYFGEGSFLARSLSQIGESFFQVKVVNHPTNENYKKVLKEVRAKLEKAKYSAIFIEPLPQHLLEKVPTEFLVGLKKLAKKYKTHLVYNETQSKEHKYNSRHFYASNNKDITPDSFFTYLGGQIGICYMSENLFIKKPLTLISTWDGDEYSLAAYHLWVNYYIKNKKEVNAEKKLFIRNFNKQYSGIFEQKITETTQTLSLKTGSLPYPLRSSFKSFGNKLLLNPSYESIKTFNKGNN